MTTGAVLLLVVIGGIMVMSVRAVHPNLAPQFKEVSDREKYERGYFHVDTMRAIEVMNRASIEVTGKGIPVSNVLGHTKPPGTPANWYQVDFSRLSARGRYHFGYDEAIVEEIERIARPRLPASMPLFVIAEGTDNEHWHAGPWREKRTGEYHYR